MAEPATADRPGTRHEHQWHMTVAVEVIAGVPQTVVHMVCRVCGEAGDDGQRSTG